MDYIFIPFAHFCTWIFDNIMERAENTPNYIFIVLGFCLLFYWLFTQGKYNKEAERNGTLK